MIYNIYCDESCHLENDDSNAMGIGGIWCPANKLKTINERIREIKIQHHISPHQEIKWTKLSPSNEALYQNIIDYFLDNDCLHFRGIIIPNKCILDHQRFNQTHDDWYYKIYFDMLKQIFNRQHSYNIYIDIKDSNSYEKSQKLWEVCKNNEYDFSGRIIKKIQPIRSHEIQLMQLVDILIGAIVYENRIFYPNQISSQAKKNIISHIKKRSDITLNKSTLYSEDKINLLVWNPNN